MALEPVDGATVAGVALPGVAPDKRLLVQTSLHDASVPNLASFDHARSLGLPRLSSSVTAPWGFASTVTTSDTGAFVIVDEHPASLPPETNEVFHFDTVAHDNPRRRTALQAQMQAFWATGTAADTCTGACDCTAGHCGPLRTATHGGT